MSDHDPQLDNLKSALNTSAPVAAAAPTAERPLTGFMRFMPPLVKDLYARNVNFTMDAKNDLLIDGFYDNGPMRVLIDERDNVKVVDKRNKTTPIRSFDDLVLVNFEWWKLTNAAAKGKKYTPPANPWLKAFQEKNLVKRQVIFVENDGQAEDLDA